MLGALLGGVGSIVSSIFGAKSADKQADLQKQFAQNGIQWKVEDAKKAGIHPLYALGANTVSYQPSQVGGPDLSFLGDMGQSIDRSRAATSEAPARAAVVMAEKLSLERAGLENELLRSQIAAQRAQVGPPVPSVTRGDGVVPHTVNPPQLTPGLNAGVGYPTNPRFSDAQSFEDRYGDSELASMGIGFMNAMADLWYNSPDWVKRSQGGMSSRKRVIPRGRYY